jgi:hypothetical protein
MMRAQLANFVVAVLAQDTFLAKRDCACPDALDLETLLKCREACGESFPQHTAKGLIDEDGDVYYWHGYADDAGISRLAKCKFTEFDMQQITPGVPPALVQYGFNSLLNASHKATMRGANNETVNVVEDAIWTYPAEFDTTDSWHVDPNPHLLFFIAGEGEWITQTGSVRLSEGALYLGDDHIIAKDLGGSGHGHFSRSVNAEVKLVHLNWELDAANTQGKPCWLH